MKQCAAIKRDGGRCERIVGAGQNYCFSHDPTRREERKRNAALGGKAKASGELKRVKTNLQALADSTLEGETDTRVAAVVTQIWNTYLAAVRTELKVREVEEFEARLRGLEEALGRQKDTRHHG
jgi:hypothetical protein